MAKTGRPSKFTPEARAAILDAVRNGAPREVAAQSAAIDDSTLYRWLEQGEADTEHDAASDFREFRDAIKKADAEAEITAITAIRASVLQWQALAWWLERRHPARWAKRDPLTEQEIKRIEERARESALREALAVLQEAGPKVHEQLRAHLARH